MSGVRGLVLVGRSLDSLQKVKQAIVADHPRVDVLTVAADVSDEGSVNQLFVTVKENFGTADTLVNNAGVITT
jgi:short-subunit dehydrogenase